MSFVYLSGQHAAPLETTRGEFADHSASAGVANPVPRTADTGEIPASATTAAASDKPGALQGVTILLSGRYSYSILLQNQPHLTRSPDALKFAVEEFLPLSAEDMNASFVRGSSLAVATNRETVADAIAAARVSPADVRYAGFAPLLALQWLLKRKRLPATCRIILAASDELDLIQLDQGTIVKWNWFPTPGGARHAADLHLALTQGDAPLLAFGDPEAELPDTGGGIEDCREETPPLLEMAFQMSEEVRRGKEYPLTTLPRLEGRRLPGLSGALSLLIAGVAVLLVGLAIFLTVRASRIREQTRQLSQEVENVYREAVPNGPSTALVQRTMQARLRKLGGIVQAEQQLPPRGQVLRHLQELVRAVPPDTTTKIQRISIQPPRISVEGQWTEPADFKNLEASLSASGFVNDSAARRDRSTAAAFRFTRVHEPIDEDQK